MPAPVPPACRHVLTASFALMLWLSRAVAQTGVHEQELQQSQVSCGVFLGNLFDDRSVRGAFAEYRFGKALPLGLRGQVGLYCTSDASLYADAGLIKHWSLGAWTISLSSNMGLIRTHGSNTLGCPVEFLSYVELTRHFHHTACSVALGHISNAHLAKTNPGTEILRFSVGL